MRPLATDKKNDVKIGSLASISRFWSEANAVGGRRNAIQLKNQIINSSMLRMFEWLFNFSLYCYYQMFPLRLIRSVLSRNWIAVGAIFGDTRMCVSARERLPSVFSFRRCKCSTSTDEHRFISGAGDGDAGRSELALLTASESAIIRRCSAFNTILSGLNSTETISNHSSDIADMRSESSQRTRGSA